MRLLRARTTPAPDSAVPGRRRPVPRRVRAGALAAVAAVAIPLLASCDAAPDRALVFPVDGNPSYVDTFGAARSGGRSHQGQDLMSPKMTPVVAAADGVVTSLTWSNSGLSGNSLTITDADGWRYVYIHLNNDTPGTDDGSNVYTNAFADGLQKGQRVKAGEVVGWVGDSGNAESTGSHLHFELWRPDGTVIDAYPSLRGARRFVRPEAQRQADIPVGAVDRLTGPAGSVAVSGWAVDADVDDPVKVTVLVNGNPVATAAASGFRPDVAVLQPGRGTAHGYSFTAVGAPAGSNVCVVAHSVGGGGSRWLGCERLPK